MTATQIEQAIRQLISTVIGWCKVLAGLALAVLILGTMASLSGHPIPYLPRIGSGLQEIGVFAAGVAFWLKNS